MSVSLHTMNRDEILNTFIEITVDKPDAFLQIRETLTRMGIANKSKKVLYQSCHILHKKGKYYIVHFKELFGLDGREVELLDEDIDRRNCIASTLEKWGLCKVVANKPVDTPFMKNLTIIPFKEKSEWDLQTKYKMSKKVPE